MKRLVLVMGGMGGVLVALVGVALMVVPGVGAGLAAQTTPSTPSALAVSTIPVTFLVLYQQAASTCPGLSWTVLAGIGEVETDHGRTIAPGVADGANYAGAEGPMQMEPASFAAYARPVAADRALTPAAGAEPSSPYDPVDAVYAAARMLCANRAATDLRGALFAYNHADWYVNDVISWADRYGQTADGAAGPAELLATQYALSVVGTPYRWGGESPAGGFDCSGLVQWAYAQAGTTLPRVAQAQHDQVPGVAPDKPLAPGDLVFFGADGTHVDHVGIYVGDGSMVDAPHEGAAVRVEPVAGFKPSYVSAGKP